MSELPIHATPEETHAHPVRTGRSRLDLTLALCAIAISLSSVLVAVGNERTQRQLVAANSWPFPIAGSGDDLDADGAAQTSIRLVNAGIGPARIKWVALSLHGRPVRTKAEFVEACCSVPASSANDFVQDGDAGSSAIDVVMPARGDASVMVWRRTALNALRWGALTRGARELAYRACYCSALDES